jgi:hypothetical protein
MPASFRRLRKRTPQTKRDRWTITEDALIAYKRWRVKKHGDYYPELDEQG